MPQSLLFLCLGACVGIGIVSGSAIPMWEYLSKDEKMSYLYSMFANQVDEFCEFAELQNCHQELLKFGLRKLKGMPEDHLDTMDPYQRGANSIIWDSMMEGHEMMKSDRKTQQQQRSTTTPKPNSFEDDSFQLQGAASAKIDNVYRVAPPKGFVYVAPSVQYSTGIPQYRYPDSSKFAQAQPNQNRRNYQEAPLTGPMVVKVYPDGTPVHDHHQTSLPHDEDLHQYKMSQAKIPDF